MSQPITFPYSPKWESRKPTWADRQADPVLDELLESGHHADLVTATIPADVARAMVEHHGPILESARRAVVWTTDVSDEDFPHSLRVSISVCPSSGRVHLEQTIVYFRIKWNRLMRPATPPLL